MQEDRYFYGFINEDTTSCEEKRNMSQASERKSEITKIPNS